MSVIGTVIKNHIESVLPAIKKFVEVSSRESEKHRFHENSFDDDFESDFDFYDDVSIDDDPENDSDNFFKNGDAVDFLIRQDEHYPMAGRAMFVSHTGDKRKHRKLENWEHVKPVVDLYVQIRKELNATKSNPDPEILDSLVSQLEPLLKKL